LKLVAVLSAIFIFFSACSGDSGNGVSNESGYESTLGDNFETYTESVSTGLQMTNYVLSLEGLKIYGEFAGASESDAYVFNTGVYGRMNVYVFIDGVRQYEENSQVYLSLNNMVNDGYSTLMGNGYFINASVSPTGETYQDYILTIGGHLDVDVTGSSYIIEISAAN
jgi:hypothetical protein